MGPAFMFTNSGRNHRNFNIIYNKQGNSKYIAELVYMRKLQGDVPQRPTARDANNRWTLAMMPVIMRQKVGFL